MCAAVVVALLGLVGLPQTMAQAALDPFAGGETAKQRAHVAPLPVEIVAAYVRLAQGNVVPPVKRESPKTPGQAAPGRGGAKTDDGWPARDIGIIGHIQDWLARANRTFQNRIVKRLSVPPGGAPSEAEVARKREEERAAKARAAQAAREDEARKAAAAKQAQDAQAEKERQRKAEIERQKAIDEAMAQVRAKEAEAAKAAKPAPAVPPPKPEDSTTLAEDMRKEREKLEAEAKRIEQEQAAAAAKRKEEQKAKTEARLAEQRRAAAEKSERERQDREKVSREKAEADRIAREDKAARERAAREADARDAAAREKADREAAARADAERRADDADAARNRRRTIVLTTEPIARPEPYVRGGEVAERVARGPVVNRWFRRARGACRRAGRRIRPPGHYVVASGDTLWLISARHYRNGWLYPRIYWANRGRIRNPNVIYPCERIFLPRRPR